MQKTNPVSERDFAQLNRLLKEKPNATTKSLEAMIMSFNIQATSLHENCHSAAW